MAIAFEFKKKAIRRDDINTHVFGKYPGNRMFETILQMANSMLLETFGMELTMLPHVARKARTTTAKGRQAAIRDAAKEREGQRTDVYVLTSVLPEKYRRAVGLHREPEKLGFLAVLVGCVYLAGGEISEDELGGVLEPFEVSLREGGEADEQLGSVAELMEELRRQKYLVRTQLDDDNRTAVWSLGPRARVEFPPAALADLALQMAQAVDQEAPGLADKVKKSFGVSVAVEEEGDEVSADEMEE
jgi:hypothetical protein